MATNNPYGWMGNPGQQAPQYNYNQTPYQYGGGGSGLNKSYSPPNQNPLITDWGPSGKPGQNQGQMPAYQPSYNPGASNQGLNDLMSQWRGSPFSNTSYYGNKDQSMNADRYATNYATPYGNLLLQQEANQAQRDQFAATLGMQNWVNQAQYGLDQQANQRENIGLDFGMYTNQRDYNAAQQQFGATMGLNYAQLGQQGDIAKMQNQTALQGLQNQMGIASMQNQTELSGQKNQFNIASMQNQTNKYGIDVGAQSQKYAVDTAAKTAAAELGLDYARLSQDQKQFVDDLALRKLTQQQSYGIQQGQLGVQQGQLGVQQSAERRLGQQMNLDERFRQQQLAQEAQLMRENYANQMMQSRYSAFGRAQTPNFRNVASWR